MKPFRIFLLIILASAMLTSFAQVGAKTQQGKIYGVWVNNEFGFQMTLILNSDGAGEFDGDAIKFSTQADKLSINQSGKTMVYDFSLRGDALTLSGGDLEKAIVFTRQQGAEQIVTPLSPASTIKDSGPVAAIPKELLGVWSGYNETIEFKDDAQCIYKGQPWPYTVANNQITLQTPQGNFLVPYAISKNQLTLTLNEQTFSYSKGSSAGTSNQGVSSTSSGINKLDMSIVGKWCFIKVASGNSGSSSSSECITLNQDGTYAYYSESSRSVSAGSTASEGSDRGTWWVEGNRIFYNSETQGQGSYLLEKRNYPKTGDPMIVLDGRTFVTFYNRAPW